MNNDSASYFSFGFEVTSPLNAGYAAKDEI